MGDVPSQELLAGGDAAKRYFLIGPREGVPPPAGGRGLVVVIPGGDGSTDFHPFVKRIFKRSLPEGFLAAQPIAVKWTADQAIVWPTKTNPVPGMRFSTEDFIEAVIRDVRDRRGVDAGKVFTLTWSSSGPAGYAESLRKRKSVTGSYVAMSVFKPETLPPLGRARGHAYYIAHSPQDAVCPFGMAEEAREALETAGARVKMETYAGGHGWHGDVFERIARGIRWLVENRAGRGSGR